MSDKLFDSFDSTLEYFDIEDYKHKLEESGDSDDLGEVPQNVLGVFRVPHAFGYGKKFGISRNGRLYTKKVWENALKNKRFQEVFSNGLLVGMIGHPKDSELDEYDKMVSENIASHIIKKIKDNNIDENNGFYTIDAYIIDTPAGRTLRSLLSSGAKLSVSTRAYGTFKENAYEEIDGKKIPIIDENNFQLITIDVVATPGIKNAKIQNFKLNNEDFNVLKGKYNKYNCENGLCDIIKENKEDIEFENLSREELLDILNNLREENRKLNELFLKVKNEENINDKEYKKQVERKEKFKAYLENFAKLIKYNKNFEELYNLIIEILDKDDKIEESDFIKIKEELSKIDDGTDESILLFAKKIINFIENNESVSYFIINHFIDKNNELKELLKDQIEKISLEKYKAMKENESLTLKVKELKEKLSKYNFILKETIQNFKNDKIYSEIIEMEKIKEELEKTKNINDNLIKENLKLLDKINNFISDIESLEEKLKEEQIEKENLKNKVTELEEFLENEKTKYYKEVNELKESINDLKIKYYVYKYKITEDVVKKHIHENNVDEILKKYQKKTFISYDVNEIEEKNEVASFINRII